MNAYVIYYRRRDEDPWICFEEPRTGRAILFFGEQTAIDFALDSPDPRFRYQFYVGREGGVMSWKKAISKQMEFDDPVGILTSSAIPSGSRSSATLCPF